MGKKHTYLDTVGPVGLYVDNQTRDILITIKTDIGTVTQAMTAERACQLGVALVRESGKRFEWQNEPVQPQAGGSDSPAPLQAEPAQPEEKPNEKQPGDNDAGGPAAGQPDGPGPTAEQPGGDSGAGGGDGQPAADQPAGG